MKRYIQAEEKISSTFMNDSLWLSKVPREITVMMEEGHLSHFCPSTVYGGGEGYEEQTNNYKDACIRHLLNISLTIPVFMLMSTNLDTSSHHSGFASKYSFMDGN